MQCFVAIGFTILREPNNLKIRQDLQLTTNDGLITNFIHPDSSKIESRFSILIPNCPWADWKILNVYQDRVNWTIWNYFVHVFKAIYWKKIK